MEKLSISDNNRLILAQEIIEIINYYQLEPKDTIAAVGMVTTSVLLALLDGGLSVDALKVTQQEFIETLNRSIKIELGEK